VQRKGSKSFWLLAFGYWPEFSTMTDLTHGSKARTGRISTPGRLVAIGFWPLARVVQERKIWLRLVEKLIGGEPIKL
jgi:hypothetical protein